MDNEDLIAKGENRQMGPMTRNTDGSSSTSQPTSPTNSDGTEMQMGTPPDMNCEEGDETCEMPEMPTDMQGGFGGRGEFMTQTTSTSSDSILHPAAYLAIGGGSVVLGILISYACFSRFFHAKPGETFSTLGKFIGFIAVALTLAVGISLLGYFIPVWCS